MNQIHYIGYSSSHSSDFEYHCTEKNSSYLLLLVTTPALFEVNGTMTEFPANTAVLYPPDCTVHYKACGGEYCDDWLRFSTDESFVTKFPQFKKPFTVNDAEYCHCLFKLLTWEHSLTSENSPIYISSLLRVLFSKLSDDVNSAIDASTHSASLLSLHKHIYNNPQLEWSVDEMATQLHVSPSHLQTMYKKAFGTTCMEDVIEGRIRIASEQLAYTTKSLNEIAEFCGYHSTEHFCRQFRKLTGFTPGQYRRKAAGI